MQINKEINFKEIKCSQMNTEKIDLTKTFQSPTLYKCNLSPFNSAHLEWRTNSGIRCVHYSEVFSVDTLNSKILIASLTVCLYDIRFKILVFCNLI